MVFDSLSWLQVEEVASRYLRGSTLSSPLLIALTIHVRGFPGCSVVKNLPANARGAGERDHSPGWTDSLKEEMATHPSILACEIS